MSIEAVNWALNLPISSSAKFVCVVLGNYADPKGICWPSFETISQKTALTRRNVIKQINWLEKIGFITRIRKTEHGVNVYQLHFNIVNKMTFLNTNIDVASDPKSLPSDPKSPVEEKEVVILNHQASDPKSLPSDPKSPVLVIQDHPEYKAFINQQKSLNLNSIVDQSVDEVEKSTSTWFDKFWTAYPWKDKKKDSREVWKRKKLDRIAEKIIADVEKRKLEHGLWLDGFYPMPPTYLRGERWSDPIDPTRRKNTGSKKSVAEHNAEVVRRLLEKENTHTGNVL